MQRLAEDGYSPLAVAAALSEAAVNMAAQSPDAENFEEFALAFDGNPDNCASLHMQS